MRWLWLLALCIPLLVVCVQAGRTLPAVEANQRQQSQQELERIQQQLEHQRQQLHGNAAQEQSVLTALESISQRQEMIHSELRSLGRKLQATQQRAQVLQYEHIRLSAQVQQQRDQLAQRLRQLYKLGQRPDVALLLSARDVTDLAYKVQYAKRIARYDRQQFEQYQTGLQRVAATQAARAAEQQQVLAYQHRMDQQRQALARQRQEKERLRARLQQEKHLLDQTVQELVAAAEELTRFLASLPEPSTLLEALTAEQLRGQMPWPLQGSLLSSFGKMWHAQLEVYTLQKGVYLGASVGSEIRTIGAGKVRYANWFKGFGRLLIIDHGDHVMSLYGHTSDIFVQVGDMVQANQVIAQVGESSAVRQPALYFEIRHRTVPQDPLLWLTRRSAQLSE